MELSEQELMKFSHINEKIRQEEIRARNSLAKLCKSLDIEKEKGRIHNYEYRVTPNIFSYDEDFCISKNVEIGDPFLDNIEEYHLALHDDEFFNTNWNAFKCNNSGSSFDDFHFGYLMHFLMFHVHHRVAKNDFFAIDDVWIDVEIIYRF